MYAVFDGAACASALSLLVVGREAIAPDVRRLSLVGDDHQDFACRPGQRLVLTLDNGEGSLRRFSEVEAFDFDELRLDLIVPVGGDASAARWVDTAAISDRVTAELLAR